jgi:hypothetical protein
MVFTHVNQSFSLTPGFTQICLQNTCIADPAAASSATTDNGGTKKKKKKNQNPLCGKMRWMGKMKLQGFQSIASSDSSTDRDRDRERDTGRGGDQQHNSQRGNDAQGGMLTGIVLGVCLSFLMLVVYHKYVRVPSHQGRQGSGVSGQGEIELQGLALAPMAVVSDVNSHHNTLQSLNLLNVVPGRVLSVAGVPLAGNTNSPFSHTTTATHHKAERAGLLAGEDGDQFDEECQSMQSTVVVPVFHYDNQDDATG